MGLFNSCVGRDLGCGSHQGERSSPSLSYGDGGLGLGQEGGCRVTSGYKGNAILDCTCQSPYTKDPWSGIQGNEAPASSIKTRLMVHCRMIFLR